MYLDERFVSTVYKLNRKLIKLRNKYMNEYTCVKSGPVSILPGSPNILNVKYFLWSVILHNNLLHTLMNNTTAVGQL